jgi:hypothetical protein
MMKHQLKPDSPALLAACDYAFQTGSNVTAEQVRWIIEAFLEADETPFSDSDAPVRQVERISASALQEGDTIILWDLERKIHGIRHEQGGALKCDIRSHSQRFEGQEKVWRFVAVREKAQS